MQPDAGRQKRKRERKKGAQYITSIQKRKDDDEDDDEQVKAGANTHTQEKRGGRKRWPMSMGTTTTESDTIEDPFLAPCCSYMVYTASPSF